MPKKEKAPSKRTILDKIKPHVFSASFALDTLSLKKLIWTMRIVVTVDLPQVHHYYNIRMVFNPEPFEMRIKNLEQQLAEVEADKGLFPEMDRSRVSDKKSELNDAKAEMDHTRAQCPTVEFLAEIAASKYVKSGTQADLIIPDNIINDINKYKNMFQFYKMELERKES